MKKITKFSFTFLAIAGLLISYIAPTLVRADGEKKLVFTFSVADDVDIKIAAGGAGNVILDNNVKGEMLYAVIGDDKFMIEPKDGQDNHLSVDDVSVICTDDTHCTVTITGYDGIRFVTSGDSPYILTINGEEYFFTNTLLVQNESIVVENPPESVFEDFDGDAYLVWECSDGGTCMHEIENIGNNPFDMKYYNVSEMVDIRTGEVFDQFGDEEKRGFAFSSNMRKWIDTYKEVNEVENIDWSNVDVQYLLRGDIPDFEEELVKNGTCLQDDEDALHKCVDSHATIINYGIKLQPLGEPNGVNSYVSYGDRNFKATIYKDEYRGVSFGDMDSLTYIPHYNMDGALRVDSIDVSGTTKKNPSYTNVSLLEKTLTLKSNGINNFAIKSIEPLDVPKTAVTVGKNNNGDYVITFMSHYYDNVILEITDTENNKYYLHVERTSYEGGIRREWQQGGGGKASVYVIFYFDANTSYSDYIITAKYVYKDGTTKTVELENTGKIDDGLGNITFAKETEGGKNLKMASYEAEIDQDYEEKIEGIYFNVRYKGSTETKYAGTFAGSGLGIYYEIEEDRR